MPDGATQPRRQRRRSLASHFALVLLGVGLATALAAGAVAWFQTQQARTQQQLDNGAGAARLAASLVQLETASAAQTYACQVAGLAATSRAIAAGPSAARLAAAADRGAASKGDVLLLLGAEGQVLAQQPSGALPGLAGLLSTLRRNPASCSSGRGFFATPRPSSVLGVGMAPVGPAAALGRVVVLTPVGGQDLGFARKLVASSGANATVLLVSQGHLVHPAQLRGSCYAAGAALPRALRGAFATSLRPVQAQFRGALVVVAAQPLRSGAGASVARLVVVDYTSAVAPSVAALALPLALAVAGILLLGMVVMFLLLEQFLNRPLRRLDHAVRELPQRNYATPIAVGGADEIARLAANLDLMRKQLRRQMMTAMGRTVIASTLTSNTPLEKALPQVLRSLCDLLGTNLALLLLRPSLHIPDSRLMHYGLDGPLPDWADLESGEGVIGSLLREPRFLLCPHLEERDRGALESRLGIRNCLAEPLRAEGRDLGILLVANKPTGYVEEDSFLCNAVADQIVVAVGKSTRLAASQREATTDAMTGLYNYRFLVGYLDQQVNVAERAGVPLSVLMLDLDHFKEVNDSFGHPAGDQLLRRFASLLVESTRKSDLAARYGGEEFVVVMANTGRDDAQLVADKIRQAVEAMRVGLEDGRELRLTVSIGGVSFPSGSRGERNLLDLADRALYAAKRKGRNCVEFLDLAVGSEEPALG